MLFSAYCNQGGVPTIVTALDKALIVSRGSSSSHLVKEFSSPVSSLLHVPKPLTPLSSVSSNSSSTSSSSSSTSSFFACILDDKSLYALETGTDTNASSLNIVADTKLPRRGYAVTSLELPGPPATSSSTSTSSSSSSSSSEIVLVIGDKVGDVLAFPFPQVHTKKRALLAHTGSIVTVLSSVACGASSSSSSSSFSSSSSSHITGIPPSLFSADRDEKIRVSSWPNAFAIRSYCLGHTRYVSVLHVVQHAVGRKKENSYVYAPGELLVSGGGDGTLRVWHHRTGTLLHTLYLGIIGSSSSSGPSTSSGTISTPISSSGGSTSSSITYSQRLAMASLSFSAEGIHCDEAMAEASANALGDELGGGGGGGEAAEGSGGVGGGGNNRQKRGKKSDGGSTNAAENEAASRVGAGATANVGIDTNNGEGKEDDGINKSGDSTSTSSSSSSSRVLLVPTYCVPIRQSTLHGKTDDVESEEEHLLAVIVQGEPAIRLLRLRTSTTSAMITVHPLHNASTGWNGPSALPQVKLEQSGCIPLTSSTFGNTGYHSSSCSSGSVSSSGAGSMASSSSSSSLDFAFPLTLMVVEGAKSKSPIVVVGTVSGAGNSSVGAVPIAGATNTFSFHAFIQKQVQHPHHHHHHHPVEVAFSQVEEEAEVPWLAGLNKELQTIVASSTNKDILSKDPATVFSCHMSASGVEYDKGRV